MLVTWTIWKERNAHIFDKKEEPCYRVTHKIKDESIALNYGRSEDRV